MTPLARFATPSPTLGEARDRLEPDAHAHCGQRPGALPDILHGLRLAQLPLLRRVARDREDANADVHILRDRHAGDEAASARPGPVLLELVLARNAETFGPFGEQRASRARTIGNSTRNLPVTHYSIGTY